MGMLEALGAVLAAVAAAWFFGRRSGKQSADAKAGKAYQDATERMDNAERDLPDNMPELREWLRKRGEQ